MDGLSSSADQRRAPTMRGAARAPARHRKSSERLARQIAGLILREGYPVGHVMPSEKEMLEQLEVGRTTLREALRILEVQGVIVMKAGPHGGPMVAQPTSEGIADHLALVLQLQGATFGQVIEARSVFESSMAELAAARIEESELTALRRTVELMAEHLDDPPEFFFQNRLFHSLIAAGTGNPAFVLYVDSLNAITEGTPIGGLSSRGRRLRVLALHDDVVTALQAHDPDAARRAMSTHMNEYRDYLVSSFPELLAQPIRWLVSPP